MNALLRKKKEWEFRNEKYLYRLVETSADVSIESVKLAGLITSFLAYLVYRICEALLAIAFAIFIGPKLVRYTEETHFEYVEPSTHRLEAHLKNPRIHG